MLKGVTVEMTWKHFKRFVKSRVMTRIDSLVQAHSQNKLHQDSSQEPATTNNLSIQSLLLKYNENQLQNLLLYNVVVFWIWSEQNLSAKSVSWQACRVSAPRSTRYQHIVLSETEWFNFYYFSNGIALLAISVSRFNVRCWKLNKSINLVTQSCWEKKQIEEYLCSIPASSVAPVVSLPDTEKWPSWAVAGLRSCIVETMLMLM